MLDENLTGVRVIRAFDRIGHEKRRFDVANADLTDTTITVNQIVAVLMPVMMLILNLATIAIIWFGSIRIDQGEMQVGALIAFLQYAMQILFSLLMVSMMFIMVPRASASADAHQRGAGDDSRDQGRRRTVQQRERGARHLSSSAM